MYILKSFNGEFYKFKTLKEARSFSKESKIAGLIYNSNQFKKWSAERTRELESNIKFIELKEKPGIFWGTYKNLVREMISVQTLVGEINAET